MVNSLRFRLLTGFLLVAIVAVGTVALLASRTTSGEIQGYVERRVAGDFRRIERLVGGYYAMNRTWSGVQTVIEGASEVSGDHVVVVDNNGRVVADSSGKLVGQEAGRNWSGGPMPIGVPGSPPAGTLYLNPQVIQPPELAVLDAVNRSLWVAAGGAVLLALLFTLALSRAIVRPLEALTAAARRIEGGDLAQRVDVRGGGEVGELARAFNSMAGAMAHNEELRRCMVSDVAHELRTPLTNIRGHLEAVADGVLPPDRETIDSILEEAHLLGRLVDDLQQLALAEAGQLRLYLQPEEVSQIIARATIPLQPQFSTRQLQMEVLVPEDLPLVVADAERVGQVLRNLLNNAAAYTPEGGRVSVSARQQGEMVELAVSDTGSGISPADLPNVFERFYRADQSRARATGGAGLGLAIARQIVESHGGSITVASEVGKGTTFTFCLPALLATTSTGVLPAVEAR
ncbi:MAG: sensor histidine kinase [Chloroflexota bacterium]